MYRFAQLLVVATFLLLIAGGLVTSTGSALAVPDWPLSYGRLMPPMVGGILFEHGHRMIASTVGALTLILTLWIGLREPRRWVRQLALVAFGAVVLQGILGGMTVLWHLPIPISIAHACLGQTFFALVVILTAIYGDDVRNAPPDARGSRAPMLGVVQLASLDDPQRGSSSLRAQPRSSVRHSADGHRARSASRAASLDTPARGGTLGPAAALTMAAIYLQLILGAMLRHAGWHPWLLIAHATTALVVLLLIIRTGHLPLALLVGLQLVLGLATWISHRPVWAATAHVAVGALLLANAVLLAWRTRSRTLSLAGLRDRLAAYLELTKPRLTLMAVATTLAGAYIGAVGPLPLGRLVATLAGAFLVGAGAGALNQYLERDADARMRRTQSRPLPTKRVTPRAAGWFGLLLTGGGVATLALGVNTLAAGLGLAILISYLGWYTPLKTRTSLCTLVGAIPGAIPPLIGWVAVRGTLDPDAWILFALLFLWQLPHFLALAWLHREDYARGGFRMLPVIDPSGHAVGRQITLYCLALVPASLLPTLMHLTGPVYFVGALALSVGFLSIGLILALAPTPAAARRLFRTSLAYLPILLLTMAWDKLPW